MLIVTDAGVTNLEGEDTVGCFGVGNDVSKGEPWVGPFVEDHSIDALNDLIDADLPG
jgi:hypothetical protein